MNTGTIKRFLTALSSAVEIERGQLYQLIQSAETGYYLRDTQSQREIGLLLQSFAYPFNQVGKYYESIYLYRTGQFEKAREMLENVADCAPARYRSKALLSLSAVEEYIGHFEESLRLRLQVPPLTDPVTLIETQRGIAVLRSLEGEHRTALRDLERLMPLAHIIGKHGHPAYLTFLNSYALELSETTRTAEATEVAKIIATSPLIGRYPEWRETVAEVLSKRRSRSIVSFSTLQKQIETEPDNVVQFPTGKRLMDLQAALESGESSEPSGLSITPLQLLALILKIVLKERITEAEIDKICNTYYDTVIKWYPLTDLTDL